MDNALLKPLDALEKSLHSLVQSLTTTNTFSNAPTATKDLLSADDALTSALTTLRQHQENYARILKLRAEANRLNSQIKTTIRNCVNLRTEIGDIHPGILQDSDDDEDNEKIQEQGGDIASSSKAQRVDYETLLAFAARIGKHNAAAAREAEQESIRRRTAAKQKPEEQKQPPITTTTNGTAPPSTHNDTSTTDTTAAPAGAEPAPTTTTSAAADQNPTSTQESQAEVAAIHENLSAQRAYHGMAFPAAERLRMGALGRVQYLREQEGDEAAEAEVERMVRESEDVGAATEGEDAGGDGGRVGERSEGQQAVMSSDVAQRSERAVPSRPARAETGSGSLSGPGAATGAPPPQPPKKKLNLDLDFPDSDEDEE